MRTFLLSLTAFAALSLAALTPGEASALGWRTAYYSGYYTPTYSYYTPTYSYSSAYPYYTTSTFGGYSVAPYSASYYTPTYSYPTYSYPTTSYYYTPGASYYYSPAPVYSGPQYFQGYTPTRVWIYP